MRQRYFIAGILMLVISVPLFAFYTSATQQIVVPKDPFEKLFYPTAAQDLQDAKNAQAVSLCFLVAGVACMVSGIRLKDSPF